MKKVLLGLTGLALAATSLLAIEDGNYRCVVTQISVGKVYKKLAEKDYQVIDFTKNDQSINDGTDTFKYTYSEGKLDFFENKKLTIGLPSYDVGSKLFKFGYTLNDKDLTLIGWCKNLKYVGNK